MSSTKALKDITVKHGGEYFPSAVGEVNVVKKMKETNAVIGGEGNGGISRAACASCPGSHKRGGVRRRTYTGNGQGSQVEPLVHVEAEGAGVGPAVETKTLV